jgi:hypothetical protein
MCGVGHNSGPIEKKADRLFGKVPAIIPPPEAAGCLNPADLSAHLFRELPSQFIAEKSLKC